MRFYAIGDIHGQLSRLRAAHERIARDREVTGDGAAPVVHLGDLVDRGPDSRGVIDLLVEGIAGGAPWIALRGNHDKFFLQAISRVGDPTEADLMWLEPRFGGRATLASYGVKTGGLRGRRAILEDARTAVPRHHLQFLETLEPMRATVDLLFVHAGIRPGVPVTLQDPEDLMWIRDPFLLDPRDHGPLVVHGHTVCEAPEHRGNRVNLDTGAGYGKALTAAVFEGREAWVLGEDGRERLVPSR
jgi:serine/threonine protein phosphatase 1